AVSARRRHARDWPAACDPRRRCRRRIGSVPGRSRARAESSLPQATGAKRPRAQARPGPECFDSLSRPAASVVLFALELGLHFGADVEVRADVLPYVDVPQGIVWAEVI